MNNNMLKKWRSKISNKRHGSNVPGQLNGGPENPNAAISHKKDHILTNFDVRMNNLIEALFAFWSDRKQAMSAETFY